MIINKSFAKELASELLRINAIMLRPNEPFQWASGWNSPIYCDNRLTLRYPELRKRITNAFVEVIEAIAPDVEVITGTATAGIPHAAWIAQKLDKPLAYVRSTAKTYGLGNQIEGGVDKGQSTIIIEDLVSTGGSALSVANALNFIGADIRGVVSIFTYGFDKSMEKFERKGLPVYALTDYATLIEVAVEKEVIREADLELLSRWRSQPERWPQ
ncbi:MAG: orotate phosphoribosyltransferase [Balneolaceae bacterium]